MTTVDQHGLQWRFRGIPYYSDPNDPDRITGYVECEPWKEADLTPEQLAEVDALLAEHMAHRPQDDPAEARYGILEHNGIEHTHRWGPIPNYRGPGRACALCQVWEIPTGAARSAVSGRPLENGDDLSMPNLSSE